MKVEVVNRRPGGRPQYRLGDAVLKRNERYGQYALRQVANAESFFKGTILYDYAHHIDRDSHDPQWSILADIVRRKSAELDVDPPAPDELVVHLRAGNVKGYGDTAARLVAYVTAALKTLPTVARVSLVTAIHFGEGYLNQHDGGERLETEIASWRHKVREILELFAARGIAAKLVSHPDADVDFCYMAHARSLVLGNGHFSLCAAMVSSAETFVPDWARRGTYVDIDELLRSRDPAICISP